MADARQCWLIATLARGQVLPFLAALAPHLGAATVCDLRLVPLADGGAQILLPHWTEPPRRPEADLLALREAAARAVEGATGHAPLKRDLASRNLDTADPVEAAIWRTLAAALVPREPPRRGAAPPLKLALIEGELDDVGGLSMRTGPSG